MKYQNSRRAIITPIVLALAVIAGIIIGRFFKPGNRDTTFYVYPRTDKINKVLNYVSQDYVDPIDKEELVETVIPKVLETLDPHSHYIPATDLQTVNEPLEGNFSGIGIQFNMLQDTLVVLSTIENGPSEKIGILAGDRILFVDGEPVAGVNMPSDSIVRRLKGKEGTRVNVEIDRRGVNELIAFDITRAKIPLYSVDISTMLDEEIGYIKINKFSRTTYNEFMESIQRLKQMGLQKLILDLRNNGGGYMDAAVRIADQFLESDKLIVYTQGNARRREEYRSTDRGECKDIELVILIDEGSASASEILAGAIQDNDRGTIIGRRSFGKGLVQEQKLFADGSAIRLTIARYYTPTGRSIQKSYENGMEDYYNDLNNRYLNGEFMTKDSIHFNDSLQYLTPGGKLVYGGGGIMPDIFIPFDTSGLTGYYTQVRNKGLIHKFALQYSDNMRSELSQMKDQDEVAAYLGKHNILDQFIKYAKQNGIKPNWLEINDSEEILEVQLKAYIARNFFDSEGFYPIILTIDKTFNKALEILQ